MGVGFPPPAFPSLALIPSSGFPRVLASEVAAGTVHERTMPATESLFSSHPEILYQPQTHLQAHLLPPWAFGIVTPSHGWCHVHQENVPLPTLLHCPPQNGQCPEVQTVTCEALLIMYVGGGRGSRSATWNRSGGARGRRG